MSSKRSTPPASFDEWLKLTSPPNENESKKIRPDIRLIQLWKKHNPKNTISSATQTFLAENKITLEYVSKMTTIS